LLFDQNPRIGRKKLNFPYFIINFYETRKKEQSHFAIKWFVLCVLYSILFMQLAIGSKINKRPNQ